jgi:uncharacterized membrane protein YedE/YeeE
MMHSFTLALLGGILIGLASTLMLIGLGRVTGISGFCASVFELGKQEYWKLFFLFGLLVGGLMMHSLFAPQFFNYQLNSDYLRIIVAGLLVGLGTRLGNGCTSGHGVCGIARLSKRSIVATLVFIASGMLIVGIEGVIK